jgi:hypothetical protein
MSSDDSIGARRSGSRSVMSGLHRRAMVVLLSLAVACPAAAQEDHSGLTPESYRRKCLMCHSRAAPEGVSPEILAGLRPEPGLRPADVMPGVTCWRRCTTCWGSTATPAAPVTPPKASPSSAGGGRTGGFASKAASLLRWRVWASR